MNEMPLQSLAPNAAPTIDARALREELSISDEADPTTVDFLRFVIRLSEALDVDIPATDHPQLATLRGAVAYVERCRV